MAEFASGFELFVSDAKDGGDGAHRWIGFALREALSYLFQSKATGFSVACGSPIRFICGIDSQFYQTALN